VLASQSSTRATDKKDVVGVCFVDVCSLHSSYLMDERGY